MLRKSNNECQIGDKIWIENVENVRHKCLIKGLDDGDMNDIIINEQELKDNDEE